MWKLSPVQQRDAGVRQDRLLAAVGIVVLDQAAAQGNAPGQTSWRNIFARKQWVFCSAATGQLIELRRLTALGIKRHIKIRGDANPYDLKDAEYFRLRRELGSSRWVTVRA